MVSERTDVSLVTPYRGDGTERPEEIPLPPDSMPLFYGTRLRKRWRYVALGTLPNGIRLFEAHGVMERHDALW